jgi:hypothetical protein
MWLSRRRTYSTLISGHKGKTRLQQVIDWVGGPDFSGPLVMDECHKAKNFVPGKESQSTKVGAAVLELQKALPKARVVYCRCQTRQGYYMFSRFLST